MRMKQYIHLKNKTYYFRARYPQHLVEVIGRRELKRSLKTDSRSEADKLVVPVLQEFNDTVAEAERNLVVKHEARRKELSESDIMRLVAVWHKQSKGMYRYSTKANKSDGNAAAERRAFLLRSEESIRRKKEEMLGLGNYDAVYPMVKGILKRANLTADIDSEAYNNLCHTVLRAWIDLEETAVLRLRGNFSDKPSDELIETLRQATSPAMGQPEAKAVTQRSISDLIEAFTKDKQASWAKATAISYDTVFDFLKDALGSSTNINEVDRITARSLKDTIESLPVNWRKKPELKGLSISAAIEKGASLGLPTIQYLTAQTTYLRTINTLFWWALREQWVAGNSFDGLAIKQTDAEKAKAIKGKKKPIPLHLLKTLFNNQPWSDGEEYFKGCPSYYWGPLIALYHGCRVGEIASMLVSDIILVDGVDAFSFTDILDDETFRRKYKSKNTGRDVPIHPELLKMGFMEFVKRQKQQGHRQLFPEHEKSANNKWGRKLTGWFNKHLKALSDEPIRCSFHSFRHGFEDALRDAGLHQTAEGLALGGRGDKNSNDVASGYGDGFKVTTLLPHIKKVQYEGLDLSHLYVQAHRPT